MLEFVKFVPLAVAFAVEEFVGENAEVVVTFVLAESFGFEKLALPLFLGLQDKLEVALLFGADSEA